MADVQIAIIDQQNTQIALSAPSETEVTVAVPGVQGPVGEGVPSGGTTNQVLFKQSGTDYDTAWSEVTSAMIANGTIVNADVNASAAIAGTKISPDFGSQNVATTGTATAAALIPTGSSVPSNGVYLPSANNVAISTNGTGRLFVDASGNVLINDSASVTSNVSAYLLIRQVNAAADTSIGIINAQNSDANAAVKIQAGQFTRRGGEIVFGRENGADWSTTTAADGYIAFSPVLNNINTERLRITSAGLVGIGTSAPLALLDNRGHARISATDNGNTVLAFGRSGAVLTGAPEGVSGNAFVVANSSTAAGAPGYLGLWTTSGGVVSERLRISPEGRVGIGTTAVAALLHAAGTVGGGDVAVRIQNSAATDSAGSATLEFVQGAGHSAGKIVSVRQGNYSSTAANQDSALAFHTALDGVNYERFRCDSSGRLLVGTSTSTGFDGASAKLQVENPYVAASFVSRTNDIYGSTLFLAKSRGSGATIVQSGDAIGGISFNGADGSDLQTSAAYIQAFVDGTPGFNDMPGRLVFSTTADSASSPTERLRINSSGAIGLSGANFGSAGQVLVSNGSSAAPSWEQITPTAVFGWDHDNDTYGLYLPGTSIKTSDLTGTVDIAVQSRMRRCVINDSGVVQYYLDADDSDLKSGDWLRIVETEALDTAYTGTISESTNSLLRVGVPAWAAGTFTLGQRVTHSGSLWECIAATTTATPGAGTVASDLTGTDGQVVVEIPAFSVRYGFLNGVHTREVKIGCSDVLIAQGFQPHPAFIKTDGSYKDVFYIGAYHTYDDSGTGASVSGQTNTRSQTRATFRTEAEARGTGWHVLSYLELAAIQTLLVCEYQDHNSQRAIGNGADAGVTYGVTTGQSDGDGNHSVNSTDNVSDGDDYMAYRGIENLYGRAWQFVDGINVYERVVYLSNDQTAFDDNTSDGYKFYAQVPSASSSYQKELQPLADVFLPSVVTGGSSTTYLGDPFWTSTGWRVALVGGDSNDGARVGAFTLYLGFDSGIANSTVGARLAYAQN